MFWCKLLVCVLSPLAHTGSTSSATSGGRHRSRTLNVKSYKGLESMDSDESELRRIREGASDLEVANLGRDETIEAFRVICEANSAEVLSVASQVLGAILENREKDMHAQAWERLLHCSFVDRCGPHPTEQDMKDWSLLSPEGKIEHQRHLRWSMRMLLNAFDPDLGLRRWRWWNARIIDSCTLEILVISPNDMYPWQSLRWLFIGSGATDVIEAGA